MSAKAPKIKRWEAMRRSATLLATVRHLEGASVDDALLLFDVLMATRLLSRAARAGREQKLQSLPRLRKAAADLAAAVAVVYETPLEAEKGPTRAADLVGRIEQVVSKERLTAALDLIAQLVPGEEDDDDLEWRAELVARFKTVRPFIDSLAQAIPWGCTPAGMPIVKAVKDLPTLLARGKHAGVEHVREHDALVTGSWRRLVYQNPNLPDVSLDRAAYTFCLLEALHGALRRRDVYAIGADRWGRSAWQADPAAGMAGAPRQRLDRARPGDGPGPASAGSRRGPGRRLQAGRGQPGRHGQRRPVELGEAGGAATAGRLPGGASPPRRRSW
jgi:hypothetical protein